MNANHAKKPRHTIYTHACAHTHIYVYVHIYMYVYEKRKCIQLTMSDFFVFGGGGFL